MLVAIYVGQVVILVAAAVLVGWRLMRSNHETAAGLVLALVLLKPNTAILVPFVLLMAGRWRTFAVFAGTSVVAVGASYLIVGPEGASDYLDSLTRLPGGASALTLYGTFGITGALATLTRGAILVGAVAGAYLSRSRPGLVMALGALASLLTSPYLHNSDLCVLVAAAWMVWYEAPSWKPAIIAMLIAASPLLSERYLGPNLHGWAAIELAFFVALIATSLVNRVFGGAEKASAKSPQLRPELSA